MDRFSIQNALQEVLRKHHGVEPLQLEPEEYLGEKVPAMKWQPSVLFQVGSVLWGIEIVLGDDLSEETAERMRAAVEIVPNLLTALLLPEGEESPEVDAMAREFGLTKIIWGERGYEIVTPEAMRVEAPSAAPTSRISPQLRGDLLSLSHLDPKILNILSEFAREHQSLAESGIDDESELQLLCATFDKLLGCDERFAGTIQPLLDLRRSELMWAGTDHSFRDHFYHSFQDFLLGCVVIDACQDLFQDFLVQAFPGNANLSSEYVWLLVALYHDVGYLTQKGEAWVDARFGSAAALNPLTGTREATLAEHDAGQRNQIWTNHVNRRKTLSSLYDHLVAEEITEGWVQDTLAPYEVHPLDESLKISFHSESSHGAASALRLLADISEHISGTPKASRPFINLHVYLAALSIPFHDWRARKAMITVGIASIRTSRFPFAALLAYIDSVQDDRRDITGVQPESYDALIGISVVNHTVTALIDTSKFSPATMQGKQREARGVKEFFMQDGLEFRYPKDFE